MQFNNVGKKEGSMNDTGKSFLIDFAWLCAMVVCMVAIFAIFVGFGFENGKHTQMGINQNTLASCQELVSKK